MGRSLRCAEGCRRLPWRSCSNARRDPSRASLPRPAGAATRDRLGSPHYACATCAGLACGSVPCHARARARCSARMSEWSAEATARRTLVTAEAQERGLGRTDESIALRRLNALAAVARSGATAGANPAASEPLRLSDCRDRRRPRTALPPATGSRTGREDAVALSAAHCALRPLPAFAARASARKESVPFDGRCAKERSAMSETSEAPSQTHPRAHGVTRSRLGKARRSADESAKSTPPTMRSSEVTRSRGRHRCAPSVALPGSTTARDKPTWASSDDDRMLRLPGAPRARAIDAREACRSRASCRFPQPVMRHLQRLHDDLRSVGIEIGRGPLHRQRVLDLPRPGALG
jgi:hypothetical protein